MTMVFTGTIRHGRLSPAVLRFDIPLGYCQKSEVDLHPEHFDVLEASSIKANVGDILMVSLIEQNGRLEIKSILAHNGKNLKTEHAAPEPKL